MTGILDTVRKLVGAGDSAGPFDQDLLIHINSTMSVLTQLGLGPVNGFFVTENSKWNEFLGDGLKLEMVKTYVYLKVRLIFDPPQNASLLEAIKSQISEYEWRIFTEVDPPALTSTVPETEGGDPSV